jgi:quinohemoprotein amine dehydrogenase beta subunit
MVTALALGLGLSLAAGAVFAATDTALVPGKEYMAVANYPNQLHVLDLETDSIYKTCEVPGAFSPAVIQISPDSSTAYVINNRFEDVHGIALDSCEVVFQASMAQRPNERTKALFAISVSRDGSELYVIQTPTLLHADHYRVQEPRLAVYETSAGMGAKPVRTYPVPRQVTVMQTADDGSLYMAGADIYKFDPHSGAIETAITARHWERPLYAPPDVLSVWPLQTHTRDFTVMYVTARFQDESFDLDTADWIYGFMNVDLKTGETEVVDFGEVIEIYFTGMRSPKDRNILYGVLNRLAKYDIEKQELLAATEIDHSYYVVFLNKDGSKVYLAGTWDDVAVYDADSLDKITNIKLPGGDMGTVTPQIFVR